MRKQIRRHIYFSGRVQEVGFRFTACLLARRLGLTGWVKNLGTAGLKWRFREQRMRSAV
mgnify:CR=1 FL=1